MKLLLKTSLAAVCGLLVLGCSNENPLSVAPQDETATNAYTYDWYCERSVTTSSYGWPATVVNPTTTGTVELVRNTQAPGSANGGNLVHFTCTDFWNPTWKQGKTFGKNILGRPAFALHTLYGNLEVVVREKVGTSVLLRHFYRDKSTQNWYEGVLFGSSISTGPLYGNPSMVCSKLNNNLEVVVPDAQGYLVHYWRRNTDLSWNCNGRISVQGYGNLYIDPTAAGTRSDTRLAEDADGRLHIMCYAHVNGTNNYTWKLLHVYRTTDKVWKLANDPISVNDFDLKMQGNALYLLVRAGDKVILYNGTFDPALGRTVWRFGDYDYQMGPANAYHLSLYRWEGYYSGMKYGSWYFIGPSKVNNQYTNVLNMYR